MAQRPQIIHLVQLAELPVARRTAGCPGITTSTSTLPPLRLRGRDAAGKAGLEETLLDDGVLEHAVPEDGDQGPKAGDAGADDGDVGFEGGPDAEIDAQPCIMK